MVSQKDRIEKDIARSSLLCMAIQNIALLLDLIKACKKIPNLPISFF